MTRWIPAAAIAGLVVSATALYAQTPKEAKPRRNSFPAGNIEGRVLDDNGIPVVGAMVSVVGRTTAAASTDREGRYSLRELPFGPYILSVHSRGYFKSRGRTVQLTTAKISIPEIQLARAQNTSSVPRVNTAVLKPAPEAAPVQATLAGFGFEASQPATPAAVATTAAQPAAPPSDEDEDGEGETAWRLRHLPRSILKDAATDGVWAANDEQDSRWFTRHSSTAAAAALVPIAFFSDLPLSGQLNLMTIESFNRPGEIFAEDAPRSVAFVSVNTQ